MARLILFGTPRLERDGQPVALRRKSLALLAYLAVTGQPQRRETLLALILPAFDEESARNNLRRELSLLRTALGDEAVAADRQQVAWRQSPAHEVDVTQFVELIAAARQHRHPDGLCDACAAALTAAVGLAGGEFLAGYSLDDSQPFEEWLLFQREELRRQLAWALEALVDWHEGRDEPEAGLTLARRWQALDPLHEPALRAVMRLYAHSGQQAAALRQYEDGVRLLAEELGAEPEPATAELAEAIRARTFAPSRRPAPPAREHVGLRSSASSEAVGSPATSFIGRRRDIAALAGLLADPACRLLTLLGPGGVGKTRLAAEVAVHCGGRFADGAVVVPLAAATAPAQIPDAAAAAFGLTLPGSGDPWASLATLLRQREQLLILDNVEQLLDAAPRLAELLRVVPGLTLLATSREALKLQEEWVYPVEGLGLPADGEEAADAEAVQLFVARAQQARRGFTLTAEREAVVRICRLVGGMPLAIELAAAWANTLSCEEIAAEVASGLAFLESSARNTPARQRSVEAIFDQTWERLDDRVRAALARLSVFTSGFTREAAAEVAGATPAVLARLLDHALLRRDDDGRYRFHALVRQYAARRLQESADGAEATAACGRYYTQFLRAQFARQMGGEQRAAIGAIRAERENIRALLPAMLAQPPGEPLREILQALDFFYFTCGPYQEGVELLGAAEGRLRAAGGSAEARRVLAHVLTSLGFFAVRGGAIGEARARFAESGELLGQLGMPPSPGDATDPAIGLGVIALVEGDYAAAAQFGEQARARSEAHGLAFNLAYAWYLLAEAAQTQGLMARAESTARRALALARAAGAEWLSAYVHNQLGQVAAQQGRYAEATEQFAASYTIREAFGDHEGMALALLLQGELSSRRGEHEAARRQYAEGLALYRKIGDRGGAARALLGLGTTDLALGAGAHAWEWLRASLALARELRYHHVILDALITAAELLGTQGRGEGAIELLALVVRHPASRTHTSERAQGLLLRYEGELAHDVFSAGIERGQHLTLELALAELLEGAGRQDR